LSIHNTPHRLLSHLTPPEFLKLRKIKSEKRVECEGEGEGEKGWKQMVEIF
jgi:hypothetical protein